MNIGLFGGTFDPIHHGHLALAQAAKERCSLRSIYFVPANVPPHKQMQPLSSYFDRYAMVVLATLGDKAFVPSLLEAPNLEELNSTPRKGPPQERGSCVNYSIDTVRRLKATLGKTDRLFFLIGIDAFREIAAWREPEALLGQCEFIVASRPGYSLADVANALPEGLRPQPSVTKPFRKQPATGELVLPGVTIHLLENVHHDVSATAIRESAAKQRRLTRFVSPAVAEYIRKRNLYKNS